MTTRKYIVTSAALTEALASVLDIAGTQRSGSLLTPEERDYLALAGDWKMVGEDLRAAMRLHAPHATAVRPRFGRKRPSPRVPDRKRLTHAG